MKKLIFRLFAVIALACTFTLIPLTAAYANCTTSILPQSWCDGTNGDGIILALKFIRTTLIIGAGVFATGAFVVAGIMYTTAGGNEEQTKKSKTLIRNTVIGLIVAALFVSLSYLINPAGTG